MEDNTHHRRLTPLIICLLLATSFFTLGMSSATTIRPKPSDTFTITVSQPKSPVCVGESRIISVGWSPNNNGDVLAPLGGPRVIYAKAVYGTFDKGTYHPGTISGTTTFVYTAEKEGNDIITIQAMNGNLDADGVGFAELEVKKCDYRFNLYAQLNALAQAGGEEMGLMYVIRAKGRLTSEGASSAGFYEAYNVIVHIETTVTSFSISDCTLFTWTPGSGTGLVDVRAIPGKGNGQAMTVQFAPPQNMIWNVAMTAACDGEPSTLNASFPMTADNDPWIEATFPSGVGSQKVVLDMFEKGVRNFRSSTHNQATYTATLTLERVEPK